MDIPLPPRCIDMNRMAEPPPRLTDERLATLAKALGNPHRVRIVRYLTQCRSHIANDIVEEIGLSQATISEHIRALREAGIVIVVDDPPRLWHCVNRAVLAQMAAGIVGLPVPFEDSDDSRVPTTT